MTRPASPRSEPTRRRGAIAWPSSIDLAPEPLYAQAKAIRSSPPDTLSMALEPLPAGYPGEVATRYPYQDGAGEIGIVASVTRPFCRSCTRARLSADGRLYTCTCLFAGSGHDLRATLRGGVSDQALREQIAALWTMRADRHSELRTRATGRNGPA